MAYIILGLILFLVVTICLENTPTARLKRTARLLHVRFDRQVDTPVTAMAARKIHFLNQGIHQFFNVLTWSDSTAFVRICEDRMYASVLDQGPYTIVTLACAELTRGTFTPFVLAACTEPHTPAHPALPAQLATHYRLQAPENFLLNPTVIGLLKTANPCYIEVTTDTLIYHEYKTLPLEQLQPLRLRVQQLINALQYLPQEPCIPAKAQTPQTEAELQAAVLLKLHSTPTQRATSNHTLQLFYLLAGFIILISLLIAAQYYMRYFVH